MNNPVARAAITIACAFVVAALSAPTAAGQRTVGIAIVSDGPQFQLQEIEDTFRDELLALTSGEFAVRFTRFESDWSVAGVNSALDRAYSDSRIEMLLVLGFASNQIAVSRASYPKPTFLPLVFNPEILGAPASNNQSGRANLNYLADRVPIEDDIASFQRVSPFKRTVILGDALIAAAVPGIVAAIEQRAPGVQFELIRHDGRDHDLQTQIGDDTPAVLLGGLPRMPPAQFKDLIDRLTQRGIATFSLISDQEVAQGALAADSVQTDLRRIARRNALNMQAVMLGDNASEQPIYYDGKRQLTINLETARRIGLSPSFDVLAEARIINAEPKGSGPLLTLSDVARLALAHNLDLSAERIGVQIGRHSVDEARAALLPQVDLGASYLARRETAVVRNAGLAERSADSAITLKQSIYSETIRASYDQQKLLQSAREFGLDAAALNAVFEATNAYLQVLRVDTQLEIQQDNLNLTKTNLELARDRVSVGSASNADIYRWQSNLASVRADLATTTAALQQARESLNRTLHQPLTTPLNLAAAQLGDAVTMSAEEFTSLINNPARFEAFADFYVRRGLSAAPELSGLSAQIDAAARDVSAQRRAYWLPQISVQAQYTDNLNVSGFGVGGPADGASDWNVSVNGNLPLFAGGARRARLGRARLSQRQLEVQMAALTERVEQDVRAGVHTARAAFVRIRLSKTAADAARQNLALVSDAYRQGVVSIIDLLDAQTQSLQAELSANNALHDFLIELMTLQRAAGQFDFLLAPNEQDALNESLRRHIRDGTSRPSIQGDR